MGKRALIIGVNHYDHIRNLSGCINDAKEIERVLERHSHTEELEKNFDTELITTDSHKFSKSIIKDKIEELFKNQREISLLYFSGHGYIENTGGYLMTPECKRGDNGISMNEILIMANDSPAMNRFIILDCCHAGAFGNNSLHKNLTAISEGMTILAASGSNQYSLEKNGSGVFTNLLIHALEGGAANLMGEISAGSIYGYIDKAIGEKAQRPMFMTNVNRYASLRRVHTQIKANELREMITLFYEGPDMIFQLDPSFEEDSKNPIQENVTKFKTLQKYNRVNLVVPIDAPHMYHAAINSKSCQLTTLGKSYWWMVKNNRI